MCSLRGRHIHIEDQAALPHQTILPTDEGRVVSHSVLELHSGMASDEAYYTGINISQVRGTDKLPDAMLERYAISACSGHRNGFTKQLIVNAVRIVKNKTWHERYLARSRIFFSNIVHAYQM